MIAPAQSEPVMQYVVHCRVCGKSWDYATRHAGAAFCSARCRALSWRRRRRMKTRMRRAGL